MRKLSSLLIAMLFATTSFSQASSALSLIVDNQTNCPQTFIIYGDEFCVCGASYVSATITIPPVSTYTYLNTTTLGGTYPTTTPKGMVGAKILDGPVACLGGTGGSGGGVGQPACGLPPSYVFMSRHMPPNCSPCWTTTAKWYPALSSCQETAKLVFSP